MIPAEVLSGSGYQNAFRFPLAALTGEDDALALYNNREYANYRSMAISPGGWVQLDEMPKFFPEYDPFPYNSFPDTFIGALWRESGFMKRKLLGTPFSVDFWNGTSTGVTLAFANLGDSKDFLIDWSGSRTQEVVGYDWETGQISWEDMDDRFRYQLILNTGYRFDDGQYEMVMAYHTADTGSEGGWGSVGFQGFAGPRDAFGPLQGYSGVSYAFNDLDQKLHAGLVVCYDYVGPESTQADIRFQARIDESASGQDLRLNVLHKVAGVSEMAVAKTITVNGNLKLGAYGDQAVDEDGKLEGLLVAYTDLDTGANTVSVSSAHVQAVVHGHAPGASFDLIPEANFHGETQVTVTVADKLRPGDKASQSFKLLVKPVADAPTAAVKQATLAITAGQSASLDASNSLNPDGDMTVTWTGPGAIADAHALVTSVSGLPVGSHEFTVTVANGQGASSAKLMVNVAAAPSTTTPPAAESGGGGGGAFPLWVLLLLPMLRRPRR